MIRPLRRLHRWMLPILGLVVLVLVVLALRSRPAPPVVDVLPVAFSSQGREALP